MQQFSREQLRLARHLRNLSLGELGEAVGASRQYMHRLETDETARPADDMVAALGAALSVPTDLFFRQPNVRFGDVDCHFRRRRTTPVSVRENAVAYGRYFAELVSALESVLKFPAVNFSTAIQHCDTRDSIETAAEECRVKWGLGVDGPIKNVSRALEHAGAVITSFPGESDRVDAFSWTGSRPIIVRNNHKGCASRSRFDLAHECGHLVMHVGVVTGDPEHEAQADAFAGAFLLPRASFVREFPRGHRIDWSALFEMKQRWMVSLAAIVRRAHDLRLIDAAVYRNAYVYMRKRGWARNEPFEPQDEEPEAIRVGLERLAATKPARLEKVLHELSWTRELLAEVSGVVIPQDASLSDNVVPLSAARDVRARRS